VFIFQDDLIALVRIQRNVPAVEATSDAFLGPLLDAALWIGLLALAIAVVAAVSGPYAWAVRGRERTVSAARGLTAAVSERSQDEATVAWVAAHLDLLRLAGVVVGLVLLWWIELSWFGFFLLVGLVAAYELALQRLAERGAPPAEEGEDTPAASAGVDATS
jgi:hypothetical protein